MPLQVAYDESIDSIVIRVAGAVGYDEILSLRDQIIHYPNFRTNINQLFDCTEGNLNSLTTEDLKKIASDFMQIADQLGRNRKLALVGPKDVEFGMFRQYEVFFDSGPGVVVRAFRSSQEAREWLKHD